MYGPDTVLDTETYLSLFCKWKQKPKSESLSRLCLSALAFVLPGFHPKSLEVIFSGKQCGSCKKPEKQSQICFFWGFGYKHKPRSRWLFKDFLKSRSLSPNLREYLSGNNCKDNSISVFPPHALVPCHISSFPVPGSLNMHCLTLIHSPGKY